MNGSPSNIVQSTIEKQLSEETIEEREILDFNPIALYFGEDYELNDKIIIHQPTIQDFIDYGEGNIYATIAPFTCNTTSYRLPLWDMGIDWNKISEMDLFALLISTMDFNYSKLIFGNIDFSTFELYEQTLKGEKSIVLYSEKMDLTIDEDTMEKMKKYVQYMFNSTPTEPEFTSNKTLKQDLINNDRQKRLARMKGIKSGGATLLSMISFCLNHPGFKYKKSELREVGIVEFLDSVQRLQIYESTHALMSGAYGGFVDTSKINKDEFNFMRDASISA